MFETACILYFGTIGLVLFMGYLSRNDKRD